MLTSGANFIWTQDGKKCFFVCDTDTSFVIAKEALFQFQTYLGQAEAQTKAQAEAQAQAAKEAANKVEAIPETNQAQGSDGILQ